MSQSGLLVVDKPSGTTSHDVVDSLRRILRIKKIGHAGTLDPQASGVLLICVNKATKVVQFLTDYDKEYEAVIRWGITTDTYDSEGKIIRQEEDLKISSDEMKEAILSFKGRIRQTPPPYSAVKYKGKKLYQYARAHEEVERKEREVEISDIEILNANMPYLHLRIRCSKGTYIRSLAHDVGEKLGCGAYLYSLRRRRVGPFKLDEAVSLQRISDIQAEGKIEDILIPVEKALAHLPAVVVREDFAEKVQNGIPLESSSVLSVEADFEPNQTVALKDEQKKIVAIGRALASAKNFLDLGYENKLFEYIRVI